MTRTTPVTPQPSNGDPLTTPARPPSSLRALDFFPFVLGRSTKAKVERLGSQSCFFFVNMVHAGEHPYPISRTTYRTTYGGTHVKCRTRESWLRCLTRSCNLRHSKPHFRISYFSLGPVLVCPIKYLKKLLKSSVRSSPTKQYVIHYSAPTRRCRNL